MTRTKATRRKVMITCAVTGAIHTPSMSAHLPITADEIAEAAIGAHEAGAALVHLHARDPVDGRPDQRPEAFRLVQDGVVSPQDLDHTIADGLGLRWAFMGPFETIELNAPGGTADYCARYVPWFRRYVADLPRPAVWDDAQWQRVADAWGPTPQADGVARKSRWRDDRLAALVAHKRRRKPWQNP